MPRFELVTVINAACETVFALSLDVGVHAASMPRSGERPIAGVTTGPMRLGDQVTWRARHFGLWWQLTSQITAYDRPHMFIDEQICGPFAAWHHSHQFQPDGAGATLMRDVVSFAAPYGLAGRLTDTLVLTRYMTRLIRQRNRYLAAVAGDAITG